MRWAAQADACARAEEHASKLPGHIWLRLSCSSSVCALRGAARPDLARARRAAAMQRRGRAHRVLAARPLAARACCRRATRPGGCIEHACARNAPLTHQRLRVVVLRRRVLAHQHVHVRLAAAADVGQARGDTVTPPPRAERGDISAGAPLLKRNCEPCAAMSATKVGGGKARGPHRCTASTACTKCQAGAARTRRQLSPVQFCAAQRRLSCQRGTAGVPAAQQRPRGALKAANARAGCASSAAVQASAGGRSAAATPRGNAADAAASALAVARSAEEQQH